MKSLILGLSLLLSMGFAVASEYEITPLECALVLKGKGNSYQELDLSVCASAKKEKEVRNYVINDVLTSGNQLESIDLATSISDATFQSIKDDAEYLSDYGHLELLRLKAQASRVDAYYVVDNYMGGTGEVAYLVFHNVEGDLVKVFAVTTYSE